jgi:hypothetical protein
MCLFDRFLARIDNDPARKRSYTSNTDAADRIAKRIPLIHLTCKAGDLADIFLKAPNRLVPGGKSGTGRTRELEGKRHVGPGLYFYAGRAYTGDGNVAVAFDLESEDRHTGAAAPFDTGGLIAGKIQPCAGWPEPERVEFVRTSEFDIREWRLKFAMYLAGHFEQLDGYITGRPTWGDPEGILGEPSNSFHAWTFEIRFMEGADLKNIVAWSSSQTQLESFRNRLLNAAPVDFDILDQLYGSVLDVIGSVDFRGVMERWILKNHFVDLMTPTSAI